MQPDENPVDARIQHLFERIADNYNGYVEMTDWNPQSMTATVQIGLGKQSEHPENPRTKNSHIFKMRMVRFLRNLSPEEADLGTVLVELTLETGLKLVVTPLSSLVIAIVMMA